MDARLRGKPDVPLHNLFGDVGPRCPACSGLGRVLALNPAFTVKSTSRCHCGGTGVDQELLLRREIDSLIRRQQDLEATFLKEFGKKFATRGRKPPTIKNSRQFWMELIAWATADGTAIANTTTEAIIFPNVTVPANYMQDGRALRAILRGRFGTTATPTLTFAVRWGGVGGTIIMQSGAIVTATVTAAQWKIEFEIQTRANGATGSVYAMGDVTLHEDAVPTMGTVTNYGCMSPMGSAGVATPAAVTVDLTADTALSITADWSAASASNTLTGHNYLLESLN